MVAAFVTVLAVACNGASASPSPSGSSSAGPTSTSPATSAPPASTASSAAAGSPRPDPPTVADLFHAQVTDPEARWVADIDGWFITAIDPDRNSVNLYPVGGVLVFSGDDHHLVVTMPEPAGIRLFEQAGGSSSLLDSIRTADPEIVGTETIDGRDLTVLAMGTPVGMTSFGDVNPQPGPATGTLEVLVDEAGAPVQMRLGTFDVDGVRGPEVLTFDVLPGDRGSPLPHGITWTAFASARFGYTIDVPADFEQVVDGEFDTIKAQGYGGWDIHRYDLEGDSLGGFASGYLDFLATGDARYGEPTNVELYLNVGGGDVDNGILATFEYQRDGVDRVAFVALIARNDRIWDVTWRGLGENKIADRTLFLQMLTSWRFANG